MSDYLWDKTGEPDGEVERLEALLAPLAHRPRALELPALELPAQVRPFGRRRPWLFAPLGLAAAAALLLAFLLGAAVLLRPRATTEGKSVAASEAPRPRENPPVETSRRASEPPSRGAPVGGGAKAEGATAEVPKLAPRDVKGVRLASPPRRRQRLAPSPRVEAAGGGGGPALEAMSAGGGAPSLFESTRLLTKEQLVYALRLTGAKLRDVRQKTRGAENGLR
ncbi:MAG TPA: hypothetical protein VF588_21920 [Pyrinomonadaceae bacterium]|jgi:hypothetical protein